MLQVFALKYGERQTTACQFFFREASHEPLTLHFFVWLILFTSLPQMLAGFDTIHALAGDRSRIVAGHDPEVAERFKALESGVVQIA